MTFFTAFSVSLAQSTKGVSSVPSLLSSSTCTRPNRFQSSFLRPNRARAHVKTSERSQHVVRCNLPGNVEDLPLEQIPQDVFALPMYWQRPGVYGIYSKEGQLQYVAASSNIYEHIKVHLTKVPDSENNVAFVRMLTSDQVDEEQLNLFSERWVMSLYESGNELPPGNTDLIPEFRIDPVEKNIYFSNSIVTSNNDQRVEEEIKNILRNYKVVLFMKGTRNFPKCGFSKSVVDILERQFNSVDDAQDDFVCVDCLDANKNNGLRDGIKKYSNWPTIPQLYVNGDFVGGADIVQEMEMNGELPVLLNS